MILIDDRLDGRQTRCVVAHELGHAVLGHGWSPDFGDGEWLATRQERHADHWAARRLVPLDALADALLLHAGDDEAVALALDVTPDVLDDRYEAMSESERAELRRRCAVLEPAG